MVSGPLGSLDLPWYTLFMQVNDYILSPMTAYTGHMLNCNSRS